MSAAMFVTSAPSRDAVRRVPTTRLGGMPIAVLGMRETAELMIAAVRSHPRPNLPLYMTSANGEVLSRNARDRHFERIVALADLVSADGQPMVTLSRVFGESRLPERVATTDLFHDVARAAVEHGLTFYLLGASDAENRRAVETAERLHPGLRIVGRSHGYLTGDALRSQIHEINALAPDILWLALGVPREQAFVYEYGPLLTNVGIVKTSGGLFNFLSGTRARAPAWMQAVSLEWVWRVAQEPRRLLWRYMTTNPHALVLLIVRSRTVTQMLASLRCAVASRLPRLGRGATVAARAATDPAGRDVRLG